MPKRPIKQFAAALSTGPVLVDCDTESHWGCAYDGPVVTIKAQHVHRRHYMYVCLHETLHASCPEMKEKEVIRVSKDLAEVLWKRGFRLPPEPKPQQPVAEGP